MRGIENVGAALRKMCPAHVHVYVNGDAHNLLAISEVDLDNSTPHDQDHKPVHCVDPVYTSP